MTEGGELRCDDLNWDVCGGEMEIIPLVAL